MKSLRHCFFTRFISPLGGIVMLTICLRAESPVEPPPPPPPTSPPPTMPLAAVVAEILANDPEIKFYEAEIEAAKIGRRTAALWNDPEISIEGGRKTVHDERGKLQDVGVSWSLSITRTFEWPGRLALRKSIANRDVAMAELGLARFRHALGARARTLAQGLHAADAKAAAVREVADRFEALKDTFLARDPAGITPLLETRIIEAGELALRRRATEAALAAQAALIELNQLRGVATDTPLRIAAPYLKLHDAPPPGTLLAAARENNFDFRIRRLEVEQQGFLVRLARNERYPAISVSPFISQDKAGDRETTIGLGLSMPIPVTGRGRHTTAAAESRRRQAEALMLVAGRDLEREVLTTARALATKLAETRRWSPDAVEKFREAADLADRHYRLGAVPIATYVEIQNSYLDAVEALLDTQREVMETGLRLQELTGLDFNPVNHDPVNPVNKEPAP
ncbi:MAG: TolC family protein [Opitutaceae bacterium]|jgi:cobalt-zinc-cadmium efflux system outer membrane protein|nr:TolC family protein [Opitutaceae bacterium]